MTTSAPDLILHASDDAMHKNTGEPTFNESAYFNFYDPAVRLGGFMRLGNRPNEGHAEMTVCLYLPDGRRPSPNTASALIMLTRTPAAASSSAATLPSW